MAFVRSGYINLNNGRVYYVGDEGYEWSRTASSSTYAYSLWMTSTDVDPSYDDNRWVGFSLRCLYPGSA